MTQLETTISAPILLDVSTVKLHVTNEQFDRLAPLALAQPVLKERIA
jgi:hypothetical protein